MVLTVIAKFLVALTHNELAKRLTFFALEKLVKASKTKVDDDALKIVKEFLSQ